MKKEYEEKQKKKKEKEKEKEKKKDEKDKDKDKEKEKDAKSDKDEKKDDETNVGLRSTSEEPLAFSVLTSLQSQDAAKSPTAEEEEPRVFELKRSEARQPINTRLSISKPSAC